MIACVPIGSKTEVKVAVPLVNVAVPNWVPDAVTKLTVPVGVARPEPAETIAVSEIRLSANGLEFDAETVTTAVADSTTWDNTEEVLAW